MDSITLTLSPAAVSDLKNIIQYGRSKWGQLKTNHYIEKLKDQLQELTAHPNLGIKRSDILPDIRSLNIDKHIIFYRFQQNQIQIIRILHGRQNPLLHIK